LIVGGNDGPEAHHLRRRSTFGIIIGDFALAHGTGKRRSS
jgi:hypothetical protein